MSEKQVSDLKRSLVKFNLVELPAIDLDGKIIAGHQRLRVLQLLGRGEEIIEVRIPNRKLTKQEYNQYLLTSNAVHGDWNYDILRDFNTDLLLGIGFSEEELAHLWDDSLEVEDDEFSVEKELKKIRTTNIQPGDMFSLGRHKLICADSTNLNLIKKLVGKERADIIDVDLPYNIGLNYDTGVSGKKNYGGRINDSKTDNEYQIFISKIIASSLTVAKPDCHAFFWCDEKYVGMLQELYRQAGINQKRLCMWLKDNQNPTPQIVFNKVTEFCLYGTRGKPYLSDKIRNLNEILNKEVGTGNQLVDDIMDMLNIWLVKRLPGNQYEHPTEKPPALYEKALRRCSKPGDIALDLCAGSGSLMIACEQIKRTAYLSEIEPIFCQLIINRYEKYANKKAQKIN
ncbi:DNA modification methylase [Candidatus Kuenenbacteria bacterium]|nr:DNA modification methylase [Candidatus Kuenenbacteria bacterium]